MKNEELDKISRSAFPEQDTAFEAKYWENMEQLLDKRKAKRGFIFWWKSGGISLATILLIGGSWFFWNSKTEVNNTSSKDQLRIADNRTETTPFIENRHPNTSDSKQGLNSISTIEDKRSLNNKLLTTSEGDTESLGQIIENTDETNLSEVSPTNQKKGPNYTEVSAQIVDEENGYTAMYKNTANELTGQEEEKVITANVVTPNELNAKNQGTKQMINYMDKQQVSSIALPYDEKLFLSSMNSFDEEEVTTTEFGDEVKDNFDVKLFVEPMLGGFVNQDASSFGSSKPFSYLSVNPMLQFNGLAGVNIGWKMSNGFYAFSGVHYAVSAVNFQVTQTDLGLEQHLDITQGRAISSIDSTVTGYTISRVQKGTGNFGFALTDTRYKVDTNWVSVSDTTATTTPINEQKQVSYTQRLHYANIPLMIGYEYQISKWLVEGFTGMDLGILLKQSGDVYDEERQMVVKVKQLPAQKLQMTYRLGAGIGYYLLPDLSIRIRPTFKKRLISPYKGQRLPAHEIGSTLVFRWMF